MQLYMQLYAIQPYSDADEQTPGQELPGTFR